MIRHEEPEAPAAEDTSAPDAPPGMAAQDLARAGPGPSDEARAWARAMLHEEKERVADRALHLATALRQGADALASEGEPGAASTRRGAERLEAWSQRLRARDVDEIGRDLAVWAERNPVALCAGCALGAFALARVLRSASEPSLPAEADALTAS